jgi:preprotein translocase subunit SecA
VEKIFTVQIAREEDLEQMERRPQPMRLAMSGGGAPVAPPAAATVRRAVASAAASVAPVQAMPKVGRNEPCPCGSGKKFKKCHGA